MKVKKVLIIEDDESIGEAIVAALQFEGFEAMLVTDAKQAITTVRNFIPDVILLDFLLSGVDGRDVIKALKKHAGFSAIPIIFMSAYPNAEAIAQESGVDFISKPFDIGFLSEKIRRLMQAEA